MKEPNLEDLKYDKKGTLKIRKAMANAKKVKITINFDFDILEHVKALAKEAGAPYQSFLNNFLREALVGREAEEKRLDKLEREVKKIKKLIA